MNSDRGIWTMINGPDVKSYSEMDKGTFACHNQKSPPSMSHKNTKFRGNHRFHPSPSTLGNLRAESKLTASFYKNSTILMLVNDQRWCGGGTYVSRGSIQKEPRKKGAKVWSVSKFNQRHFSTCEFKILENSRTILIFKIEHIQLFEQST